MSNNKLSEENISCYLPISESLIPDAVDSISLEVDLKHCKELRVLVMGEIGGPVFCTAWALVLRAYTDQNNVKFGYNETSGPREGIGNVVFRAIIDEKATLADMVSQIQANNTTASTLVHYETSEDPMCNSFLDIFSELEVESGPPYSTSSLEPSSVSSKKVSISLRPVYLCCGSVELKLDIVRLICACSYTQQSSADIPRQLSQCYEPRTSLKHRRHAG